MTYLNAASNIASDLIPTSKEHKQVMKLQYYLAAITPTST